MENKYYCKLCGGELEPRMKIATKTTDYQLKGSWIECRSSHHKNIEDEEVCKYMYKCLRQKESWTDARKESASINMINIRSHADKNWIKNARDAKRTPEARKKVSQNSTKMWANPNHRAKRYELFLAKGKNNFAPSAPEKRTVELCKNIFGTDNVLVQYYSEKYKHNCDIYIKSLKLYIECQYFLGHGNHPVGDDIKNDIKMIEFWLEKSKTSEFFSRLLCIYLNDDVNKREEAKRNNILYLELFKEPKNEVELLLKIDNYLNTFNRSI